MNSFEQLKSMVVFAHIIDQGSLTAAAKHLSLSRAVVSYHLKKLESQLDIKLLNRSTRSMVMTEAGQLFYDRCKVVTEEASLARLQIENSKSEPEGLLKISCPVNVGLELIVPALNQFKAQFQKIDLDVNLTDDVVNIVQEGIDLAIRGAPLVDSELQATKLIALETCLCATHGYLKKWGRPKTPADLSSHQWVVYKNTPKSIELTKGTKSFTLSVKGSVSTNNASARTAFVVAGQGIGRIPMYDAKPKFADGSLVRILEEYRTHDINVYGVFAQGTSTNKKLRLLIDHLKRYFQQIESSLANA